MPDTGERAEQIEALIAPLLNDMGYGVVRVATGGGGKRRLQVMAERLDEAPITVDECAAISRSVSDLLDVEDQVAGPFTLEVSSPGIERPLVRIEDFERFAGREARVKTVALIGGRKRFRGVLKGVAGECVRLAIEGDEIALPFRAITEARLVVSDAAITASLRRSNV